MNYYEVSCDGKDYGSGPRVHICYTEADNWADAIMNAEEFFESKGYTGCEGFMTRRISRKEYEASPSGKRVE